MAKSHYYKDTSKLNLIEALKRPIKWLMMCQRDSSIEFSLNMNSKSLNLAFDIVSDWCRKIRPFQKAEMGRTTSIAYQQQLKQYLDFENFGRLGLEICNWLDFFQRCIQKEPVGTSRWRRNCMSFQKFLVCGLFVLIPTQRRSQIARVQTKDLGTISSDQVYINIGIEKNSFRKMGMRHSVGRHVFVPPPLSRYLLLWKENLLPSLTEMEGRINPSLWTLGGKRDDHQFCDTLITGWVRTSCKAICGLALTPLSIRRLRSTYAIQSIDAMDHLTPDQKPEKKMEYAFACGHTLETVMKHYVMKTAEQQVERSMLITHCVNENMFGSIDVNDNPILLPAHTSGPGRKSTTDDDSVKWNRPREMKDNGNQKMIETKSIKTLSHKRLRDRNQEGKCDKGTNKRNGHQHTEIISASSGSEEIFIRPQSSSPFIPRHLSIDNVNETFNRIKEGRWLQDTDMNWGCMLLQQKFPSVGGLDDTIVLHAGKSQSFPTGDINVYVLYTVELHWITISCKTDPGRVFVYDSLSHGRISRDLTRQVKLLMKKEHYEIEMKPVQQQSNFSDCGLFSLAFATDLCSGNDLCSVKYNQGLMRNHLVTCLKMGCMNIFPRL